MRPEELRCRTFQWLHDHTPKILMNHSVPSLVPRFCKKWSVLEVVSWNPDDMVGMTVEFHVEMIVHFGVESPDPEIVGFNPACLAKSKGRIVRIVE